MTIVNPDKYVQANGNSELYNASETMTAIHSPEGAVPWSHVQEKIQTLLQAHRNTSSSQSDNLPPAVTKHLLASADCVGKNHEGLFISGASQLENHQPAKKFAVTGGDTIGQMPHSNTPVTVASQKNESDKWMAFVVFGCPNQSRRDQSRRRDPGGTAGQ